MLAIILSWFAPCGSNACVNVDVLDDGRRRLTSTLGADRGEVFYDKQEWINFIDSVKRGEADDTL